MGKEKFSRKNFTKCVDNRLQIVYDANSSQNVDNKTERRYYILGATVGDTLKELRHAKKKTVVEAAKGIGVTPGALSNYENNIRVPRDNIKIAISNYYKKPIQKIFFAPNIHET